MSVRYGVSHGTVPYTAALYTCRCGAMAIEADLRRLVPKRWLRENEDVHVCPDCATRGAATSGDSRQTLNRA